MEEILASIRRIISEDDAPAETPTTTAAADPVPEATPEPEAIFASEPSPALMDETPSMQEPVQSDDDVLELTDLYEAPASETIGDLDVASIEPEPFPMPEPAPSTSAYAPEPSAYDSLVGESASASAASAFAGFAASMRAPEPAEPSTGGGPTIDDLARALLRPMLKDWLDANLPAIVEAAVRKEVERIARTAA